jgi:hypothetical protein
MAGDITSLAWLRCFSAVQAALPKGGSKGVTPKGVRSVGRIRQSGFAARRVGRLGERRRAVNRLRSGAAGRPGGTLRHNIDMPASQQRLGDGSRDVELFADWDVPAALVQAGDERPDL